jgi:hypothetical protein
MRSALEALLARHKDLGIRPVRSRVIRHARHDPAVLQECHEFLRPFLRLARYALVAFDWEGCGRSDRREEIESLVETRLSQNGWDQRCSAIVIDPELEVWFWGDSPYVEKVLGWTKGRARLEEWLTEKGYLRQGQRKPRQPKDAVLDAWRLCKRKPSSSYFGELAENVNFHGCTDPAFEKLCRVLRQWFSVTGLRGGENSGL